MSLNHLTELIANGITQNWTKVVAVDGSRIGLMSGATFGGLFGTDIVPSFVIIQDTSQGGVNCTALAFVGKSSPSRIWAWFTSNRANLPDRKNQIDLYESLGIKVSYDEKGIFLDGNPAVHGKWIPFSFAPEHESEKIKKLLDCLPA